VIFVSTGALQAFGFGRHRHQGFNEPPPCRELKAHEGCLRRLLFSSNIQTFATCSADHTIKIWKIDSTEEKFEAAGASTKVTLYPFSQRLLHTQIRHSVPSEHLDDLRRI
jgi:WD40 repeat protein